MEVNQQSNGNTQLNSARESFNTNVSKLRMLGSSKKVIWDSYRRNRSI
jgi:hypothetical protein